MHGVTEQHLGGETRRSDAAFLQQLRALEQSRQNRHETEALGRLALFF